MYISVYVCKYVCVNVSMFACMKRVTPSHIAYFDILTFDFLTRGTVFLQESEVVGGLLRYLKKMRTRSPLFSSLRSTRFRLVSEQRKTEERDSRFWPAGEK